MDFKNIFGEIIPLGETQYVEKVEGVARRLKNHFGNSFSEFGIPKFAVVLGTSGPKKLLEMLDSKKTVTYAQLGFPISKTKGHSPDENNGPEAKAHYGLLNGVPVLICVGRIHYYECQDMDIVTLMVRAICLLGIKDFIITNASGALIKGNRSHVSTGSIRFISSFVNEMGSNPLIGESDFFHSFSDPNNVLKKFIDKLKSLNFPRLYSSIYTAVPGPVFETKPEADKFARDADLIGMSTIPELIAIGQQGGNVVSFSLVTNLVASGCKVTHEDNLKIVQEKDEDFSRLIFEFIVQVSS
jgi:purine-nucleoside phosphorylase